jgi:hypothetical protein
MALTKWMEWMEGWRHTKGELHSLLITLEFVGVQQNQRPLDGQPTLRHLLPSFYQLIVFLIIYLLHWAWA